jgi:thiamine-phosphate pyrophosphorylase
VRPLPRVHAYTDPDIVAGADFGIRAAAIAAGGPAVALHARIRGDSTAKLATLTRRLLALARPPEAAVIVSERTDVAAATGAAGVQLAEDDLSPADARRILPEGWIGRSVHSVAEATAAVQEKSDFLVVGNIFPTGTHPGRPGAGLDLIRSTAALGVPIIAIGGITRERVAAVRAAGAYGVAAIRALWLAPDPAAAVLGLLAPWMEQG